MVHQRSHSAPPHPFFSRPNPPAFAVAAVGIFLPPLPLHPLLSRNHFCTISLSQLVCTQTKPDLYLVCHAPFLVYPGRTGFLKKGDDGCWSDEITVRSFIIDRDYIDMLHLRLELWERVLIGDEDRLAVGVISLKSAGDIQPLPFMTNLWNNNEIVGEVSGEISLTFQDTSEPDSVSQDPNHPFSPPMAIPNYGRESPTLNKADLSPNSTTSTSTSTSSSASSASSAPSSAPTSAFSTTFSSSPFGSSFFKLPFPQISNLGGGTRDTAPSRLSFFGKALPMAGHREPQQESKENFNPNPSPNNTNNNNNNNNSNSNNSNNTSLNSSLEIAQPQQEEIEISQPLTSSPPPSTSLLSPPSSSSTSRSASSSPAQTLTFLPSSTSTSTSTSTPATTEEEVPPPLPPKPKRKIPTDSEFSPISSPSSSSDPLSSPDPTTPLVPTPVSPPPLFSPPSSSSSSSNVENATSESEGGAKTLISRIARFGFGLVRSTSAEQLLPSTSSPPRSSSPSPSLQRRPPSATPVSQPQGFATSPSSSLSSSPPQTPQTISPLQPIPSLPQTISPPPAGTTPPSTSFLSSPLSPSSPPPAAGTTPSTSLSSPLSLSSSLPSPLLPTTPQSNDIIPNNNSNATIPPNNNANAENIPPNNTQSIL